MKKKLAVVMGLMMIFMCVKINAQDLTNDEKNFLNYGLREGFFFNDNDARYMDYYKRADDSRYTTYYEDGRYYYVTDYTYKDSKNNTHYVTVKYYYYGNDKVYSIQDYYYDKDGKRVYEKNESNLRNGTGTLTDILKQDNYRKKDINGTTYYLYEDTYTLDGKKHYVNIDYYYKNSDKYYTLKDYYYDNKNNKSYMVDVDDKQLSESDLKYYLEYYIKNKTGYRYDDYYVNNNRYYDDYYYNSNGDKVYYGYYKDKNGRRVYYDDYYYDKNGVKVYYSGNDARRYHYDENLYTNEREFFDKLDDMSYVRPQYHEGKKYFGDETQYPYSYLRDYDNYNTIADMFPASFAPNEKTWPKKENFTTKNKDIASMLAKQIEIERSYMGRKYFYQDTVNSLLDRYFPSIYKEASGSRSRLENFLYYFGFVDAFENKYKDTRNVRGFLYNYAEPMYYLLDNYNSRYYTDKDINNMRNSYKSEQQKSQQNSNIKKPQKKSEIQDKIYFDEKNKKIIDERRK